MKSSGARIEFTYDYLKEWLTRAKQSCGVYQLREWDKRKGIFLRHDVDFDLHGAYALSRLEKGVGIKSTFFIMTSCHSYNPLSAKNRRFLLDMAADGFEIGLHFDPSIYGDASDEDLKEKVDFEAGVVGEAAGVRVTSVSLHNPSISGRYPLFEGYENTYSKKLFNAEGYVSDSKMDFRGNDPYEVMEKAKTRPVQVLLHPMHWTEKGDDYKKIARNMVVRFADHMDEVFRRNPAYDDEMKGASLSEKMLKKEWPTASLRS